MKKENEAHTKGLTRREAVTGMAVAATTAGALLSGSGCGAPQEGGGSEGGAPASSNGNSWLIHGGTVLTMNTNREIIDDGAVAIVDGRIAAVGKASEVLQAHPDLPRKEVTGHAILPGFINSHCHSGSFLDKGVVIDTYVADSIFATDRARPVVTPEDSLVMSRLGTLDMLKCGVTTNFELGSDLAEAEVLEPFGIRLVLSYTCSDMDREQATRDLYAARPWNPDVREAQLEAASALVEKWHGYDDNRVLCQVGVWAADTVSFEMLQAAAELGRNLGVGIQVHIGQGDQEQSAVMNQYGMRSVELLQKAGFIGPTMLGGHCSTLNDAEIEILGETGSHVGYCAYKHLVYGGFTRALPMQDAGANITLGCDDSGDFIGVMRAAMSQCRLQQGLHGYKVLPIEILEWATINGAKVVGMEDEIGSLEVGKRGDVITMNLHQVHTAPVTDVTSTIVHYSQSTDVYNSWVQGRVIMEDRLVKTVDESEILENATSTARRVWDEAKSRGNIKPITQKPIIWDPCEGIKFL